MSWPNEKILNLIEDLHSTSCLWDVLSSDYKNRNKKRDAMHNLASKYELSDSDMDKKLHNLKSQFRREHKKLTDSKRSGASPKTCAWFGYQPLLFLLQGTESRGSRNTDSQETQEEQTEEVNDNDDNRLETQSTEGIEAQPNSQNKEESFAFQTANKPKRRKKNDDNLGQEAVDCMKSLSEVVIKRDEYTVYGELIAHKLRNCGRTHLQISIAQHKINEIILNLEMGTHSSSNLSYSNVRPHQQFHLQNNLHDNSASTSYFVNPPSPSPSPSYTSTHSENTCLSSASHTTLSGNAPTSTDTNTNYQTIHSYIRNYNDI